jgi:hypothetical protein
MKNCCTIAENKTAACPINGKRYKQVKLKTIMHQVTHPWKRKLAEQAYYYCTDPECEVVYFGADESLITSREMRLSEELRNNTICFCFDVSKDDLHIHKDECKAFVIEQTKQSNCDCEIRNPSGKCCLKDFKSH